MTKSELRTRIIAEAERRGFSVEDVLQVYQNRAKTVSKMRVRINGFECRLHHLTNVRVNGDSHYAMLGVTRASLRKSDFTIVLFRLCDGTERVLIVPSSVLLRQVPKGTNFKRFYVPHHPPLHLRSWVPPDIRWSSYEESWERLLWHRSQ